MRHVLASIAVLIFATAVHADIDKAKIVQHMTTEANTVILFDDQGAVVSTDDPRVVMAMIGSSGVVPKFGVSQGKKFIPAVAAMKGKVMASHSAIGRGNRLTKEKAEALLGDLIKEQSR